MEPMRVKIKESLNYNLKNKDEVAISTIRLILAAIKDHDIQNRTKKDNSEMQLSFINLDDPLLEELKDEIIDLDIDTLTPVEALMKLNSIKRRLGGKSPT